MAIFRKKKQDENSETTVQIKTEYEIYAKSSIGGRRENQDYYTAIETQYGLLLIVCDGMGGANGGAIASKMAVETIVKSVEEYEDYTTAEKLLVDVIKAANKAIFAHAQSEKSLSGMGTTVVAMLLSDEKATVAHVGDSRAYQIRNKRKVFRTTDHSMVFEMVKLGHLSEEQARLSPESNVILRALGTKPEIDIEINDNIAYVKKDRFLLCTDGVCGAVPEQMVLSLATNKKTIEECVSNMICAINNAGDAEGGSHDNLTAIIIELKGNSELKDNTKSKRWIVVLLSIILLIFALVLGTYFTLVHLDIIEKINFTLN